MPNKRGERQRLPDGWAYQIGKVVVQKGKVMFGMFDWWEFLTCTGTPMH